MLHLVLLGKAPYHGWLEKNCVSKAQLLFFFRKPFRSFVFVRNYTRVSFSISSQNLKMKLAGHTWLEIAPWENLFAF